MLLFVLPIILPLPFQAHYATPLLLGASTYASLTLGRKLGPFRVLFRWAAPAFALLFSMHGPDLFAVTWNGLDLVLSPLRVALAGLALVWFLHRALSGERAFVWAALGCLAMALSGHAPSSMAKNWVSVAPETALELGVASIVAAFALLAFGLAKSLLQPRPTR